MLQITLFLLAFLMILIPIGIYLYRVGDNRKTFADPFFDKIDNAVYFLCRINKSNMDWKEYAVSLLVTNAVLMLIGYILLRLQGSLFFNPNFMEDMGKSLSFNTVISFMTNTNLQHYAGETAMSNFSQMAVITTMMFASAASGYSACMAVIRGFCGKEMGNYFVDMTRVITRVLIPFSIIICVMLISQGVPQTLSENAVFKTIEGKFQTIPLGPKASLEAIKFFGTNGGGFLGANSGTPLENPNVFTNMLEILSMMLLPASFIIIFGLMYSNRKKEEKASAKKVSFMGSEGLPIFVAMSIIFLIGLSVCFWAEKSGNPVLGSLGLSQSTGNYEGKEVRFGIPQSALFTTVTTAFSTGAVNNSHDSLTPMGGMISLLNMMLNTVFGGIGVGLMNMLMYVLLTVFLCGLMIGRTPEYLGKKIENKEIKLIVLCMILHALLILGFSALAVITKGGLAGVSNPGFHGFSQILYEFTSSAANNGSGFEGLKDNSVFWNISTGISMFLGRYIPIVLMLVVSNSLLLKHSVKESVGTLRTNNVSFGIILAAVVLVFAALTFFPVLTLGPISEHLILGR